jgi:hypothetical protein
MRELYGGHWALNVAGDKDFQQIAKTKAVPKFDTLIKALDGKSQSGAFAKTKPKLWNPTSDFAHGGLNLLARWSGPDALVRTIQMAKSSTWSSA